MVARRQLSWLLALLWRSHPLRPQGHEAQLTPGSFQGLNGAAGWQSVFPYLSPFSNRLPLKAPQILNFSLHLEKKSQFFFLMNFNPQQSKTVAGKSFPPGPNVAPRSTTACARCSPNTPALPRRLIRAPPEQGRLPFVHLCPPLQHFPSVLLGPKPALL